MQTQQEKEKQRAGEAAVSFVKEGMVLGLGTGSTVAFFLEALSQKVRHGMKIYGVPTSEGTATLCRKLGIQLLKDKKEEIESRLEQLQN